MSQSPQDPRDPRETSALPQNSGILPSDSGRPPTSPPARRSVNSVPMNSMVLRRSAVNSVPLSSGPLSSGPLTSGPLNSSGPRYAPPLPPGIGGSESSQQLTVPLVIPRRSPTSTAKSMLPRVSAHDIERMEVVRDQCRQLCLQVFNDTSLISSLGFAGPLGGEGASLMATATATVLARDIDTAVTLVECNWEHPTLHQAFGLSPKPGLAEWLRGECDLSAIRYAVGSETSNLWVVPAGNGRLDAVRILKRLHRDDLRTRLSRPGGVLIFDLPPVLSISYGPLAAAVPEAVTLVAQMGATSTEQVAEARDKLGELNLIGVVLNAMESRVPRWLGNLI
jgi:Mrp family chromosome partitioning ATPase